MERMSDERLAEWKAIRAELYGSGPWADDLEEFYFALKAERAEVEWLQEQPEPKRESHCRTLEDWRHRAEYLESQWAACSRACAKEQTRAQAAEALLDEIERLRAKWYREAQPEQTVADTATLVCGEQLDAILAKRGNKRRSFSDFIANASDDEKAEVYEDVIKGAIKRQESSK